MSISQNSILNSSERIVFITRMSAIGDVIIVAHIVSKLKKNGYFPILITSHMTEEIAFRIKDLDAYICFEKPYETKFSFESQDLTKEQFLNKISNIKTNKKNIFIDLQKTTRSKRAKYFLNYDLSFSIEKSYSIKKRTIFRFFLILLAYFSFSQKKKNNKYKIDKIHDLQENLIDKIILKDKKEIVKLRSMNRITLKLNEQFTPPLQNYICLFPGSSGFIKSWPKEKFKELIYLTLRKSDYNIIICGSKNEELIGDYLSYPKNNRVLNLINKTSLSQTLDIVANAKYIISNDSFAGHAADAFNIPACIIFGATSPKFGFVPKYKSISIEYESLACSPCTRHGKSQCRYKNLKCFQDISSESIFKNMESIM